MSQARIGEIERRMNGVQRDLADALSRIAALQQLLNKLASGMGQGQGGGGGFFVGTATTSISARSGTTLGSGSYEVYSTAGGTLTATGVTGTARNAGASIASGKYVALQKDSVSGTMMAAPLEC